MNRYMIYIKGTKEPIWVFGDYSKIWRNEIVIGDDNLNIFIKTENRDQLIFLHPMDKIKKVTFTRSRY